MKGGDTLINKVILAGRISSEVELKEYSDKLKIASFNLAVDRGKKKNSKESTVDFLRCKAFNRTAINVHSYCRRGSLICLTGQIHNNRYEKNGETKYAAEIIIESIKFLPSMSASSKEKSPDEKWEELSYDEKLLVMNDYRARKKAEAASQSQEVTEPEPVSVQTEQRAQNTYNQRWSSELNKEDENVADDLKEKAEEIAQEFSGESSHKYTTEPSSDSDAIETVEESPETTETTQTQEDEITDKSLPF